MKMKRKLALTRSHNNMPFSKKITPSTNINRVSKCNIKQLNFSVKMKPQTTDYVLHIGRLFYVCERTVLIAVLIEVNLE